MLSEDEERYASYMASMPAPYRKEFDADATRAHEAVVARRGERSTHVEIWREDPERIVALCVVADDKPGLLSCISAALVARRIDIVGAHAYCRTRSDGAIEAVDLLWIRRLPNTGGGVSPIGAEDVGPLAEAIDRAAQGVVEDPGVVSTHVQTAPGTRPHNTSASVRIRFNTDRADGSTVLTVEAVDRPGLLLAVTRALFRADLQIVALRATTERGAAVDRFHLAELDGRTLDNKRLLSLQTAILGALEESTYAPSRPSAG